MTGPVINTMFVQAPELRGVIYNHLIDKGKFKVRVKGTCQELQ